MAKQFTIYSIPSKEGFPPRHYVLSPVELKDYIDFEVKRIYYLTDPKSPTGAHCHYEEKEFFIVISGTCTATIDQGNGIEEIPMKQNSALYVPNYVWHGFKDFSSDAILLALTSTNYSPDRHDYLEDYEAYLKIRDEKLQKHV